MSRITYESIERNDEDIARLSNLVIEAEQNTVFSKLKGGKVSLGEAASKIYLKNNQPPDNRKMKYKIKKLLKQIKL